MEKKEKKLITATNIYSFNTTTMRLITTVILYKIIGVLYFKEFLNRRPFNASAPQSVQFFSVRT